HLLARARDLLPVAEWAVLDHRREEELARALEEQREFLGDDLAVEVRALHAALDVIDRRIARDVAIEAIERLVLVVLDQHFAIEIVKFFERAGECERAANFAAALGDAREIAQRDLETRHLAEAEVAYDEVVDVVGKRQLGHRALGAEEHALL